MSSRLVRIARFGVVLLALFVFCGAAFAQDGEALVRQLSGRDEAPARDAAQLAQAYQTAIDYLMPLMSAQNVGSRYGYQIMLQDISAHASRPGAEPERLALATVLVKTLEQAEMPDTVRAWLVRQLKRVGKAESVPVLTRLMASEDEHLRDYARQALEKNPDPSATEALLKGLSTAEDATWKMGLINSLGIRRAETAVGPIAAALNDQTIGVAQAAAAALAEIGGRQSIQALSRVLEQGRDAHVRIMAAQSLVDIAAAMVEAQETTTAARIYAILHDWARTTGGREMVGIRAAAIIGLAICNPDLAAGEIVTLVQGNNSRLRGAAVEAARLSPSEAPSRALTGALPNLAPQPQAQVLSLLGDRGNPGSIEVVSGFLSSQDDSVRLAAVDALSKIGTVAGAEALMDVAVNGDRSVQRAAAAGLATMPGPDVARYLDAQADSGATGVRTVAIGLIGQRREAGAAERLLRYAAEEDNNITVAAFDAMAQVADSVDVAALADLVAKVNNDSVRNRGVAALRAVLARADDKDAAANAVIRRMESTEGETKIALLTSLSAVGGTSALDVVRQVIASADEALRNASIRTLSNWPDYEAAPVLLDIAAHNQTSLTQHVLAIRGALRLIGAGDSIPADERTTLCLRALDQAQRDEERRQAISTLGSLPSEKAGNRLLELANDENFRNEAGLAAVECAAGLSMTDRQTSRDLAQKVRDMNISDEINQRADAVIAGRGMRGLRGFGR